jgi:hypothetical protein
MKDYKSDITDISSMIHTFFSQFELTQISNTGWKKKY